MSEGAARKASKTMASAGSAGGGVAERDVSVGVASAPGVPAGAGALARRRRSREAISVDEVAIGARSEVLARPAGEVLDAMPWAGVTPDPEVLDAATFLAWL